MDEHTLTVDGMACTGCEDQVESALEAVSGVESADANHDAGTVALALDASVDETALNEAVAAAGYEVVG